MGRTAYSSAAGILGQGVLAGDLSSMRIAITLSTALIAVGVAFSVARRVAQVVTALLAAAAAVGSVALLVVFFCGLFAAAWLARGGA